MIEPFGAEREDFRAGTLAATIANVNRDPEQRAEPFNAEDFFPDRWQMAQAEEPEPQTWEEQLEIARMWNAVLGGTQTDGNPGNPGNRPDLNQ